MAWDPERDHAQDEIDALRAILLKELRRRPGDIPSLMRRAEVVARMIGDQGRISPHRKAHLQANLMQLMDGLVGNDPKQEEK
jgi:hypothetical protein